MRVERAVRVRRDALELRVHRCYRIKSKRIRMTGDGIPLRLECALRTVYNGAHALYDDRWGSHGNRLRTLLRHHPLGVVRRLVGPPKSSPK